MDLLMLIRTSNLNLKTLLKSSGLDYSQTNLTSHTGARPHPRAGRVVAGSSVRQSRDPPPPRFGGLPVVTRP